MNAAYRQMYILSRLISQEPVAKAALTAHFNVSARTIQRDISQLNAFFDHEALAQSVQYVHATQHYTLAHAADGLTDRQLLVLIKLLLATRGLNQPEMHAIVTNLRALVSPAQRLLVDRIIQNERQNFIPLHHGRDLIDVIWDFSNAILTSRSVVIDYTDRVHAASHREIRPLAIFFSESYFYVIATDLASKQDRFFRVDRIDAYQLTAEALPASHNPYNEGALRQHIQFMYAGELETIVFEYWGVPEAALDRLPTAKIIEHRAHSVVIKATVYGRGVQMWLLSQGNMVKVLSPQSLVAKMIQSTQETLAMYADQLGDGNDVPHFTI